MRWALLPCYRHVKRGIWVKRLQRIKTGVNPTPSLGSAEVDWRQVAANKGECAWKQITANNGKCVCVRNDRTDAVLGRSKITKQRKPEDNLSYSDCGAPESGWWWIWGNVKIASNFLNASELANGKLGVPTKILDSRALVVTPNLHFLFLTDRPAIALVLTF